MPSLYTVSNVFLCHPDRAAAVNAALEAKGFGHDNFQVPVVANADAKDGATKFLAAFWKMTEAQRVIVDEIVGAAAKLDGGADSTVIVQVETSFKTTTIQPGQKTAADENLFNVGYKPKEPDLFLVNLPGPDPDPKIVK